MIVSHVYCFLNMKIHLIIFSLLFCITSCNKEDDNTYYYDNTMEDIPSLWEVDCFQQIGTTLQNAIGKNYLGADTCDFDRLYIYFNGNGESITYRIHDKRIENNTSLSYSTDDNCHFDISNNGNTQRWTLAKMSYTTNGDRYERPIVYCDSTIGERHIYYKYTCREIRHDSLLYRWDPILRGKLSVPQNRVWTSNVLKGEYDGLFAKAYKAMYFNFHKNGKFTLYYKNYNTGDCHKGKYVINTGATDTLELLFDNGEKQTYTIVFAAENAFILYDKDGESAMFYHRYWYY